MTGIKLCFFVLCLIIASTHCEDSDLIFENEGPRQLDRNQNSMDNEDERILGKIYKIKDKLLGSFFDYGIFSTTPAATKEKYEEIKTEEMDDRQTDNEFNHLRRYKRQYEDYFDTHLDDDDDEDLFASGSGVRAPITTQHPPSAEYTARITFVVLEPYREQFSNRDSGPFQTLSRNLADGVNEVFDRIPGDQRARLVRIQSRPEDSFTCKVTLELQTTGYSDIEKIISDLRTHIEQTQRLGKVTVSAQEFSHKIINYNLTPNTECAANEQACKSGECFPVSKRCDRFEDCADGSDEVGCEDDQGRNGLEYTTSVPTTNPMYDEDNGLNTAQPDTNETEMTTSYPEQATEGFPDLEPSVSYPDEPSAFPPRPTSPTFSPTRPDDSEADVNNVECNFDEFRCDVSRCVPMSSRCDDKYDCIDGVDEQGCGRCKADDFVCDDGQCIEKSRECNSVLDCRNGEDERNCPCLPDEFRCSDGVCIELRKRCDGVPHCRDESDEFDCESHPQNTSWSGVHVCDTKGKFLCRDGTCISVLFRCDGKIDCPKDSSDETDCPCTSDQWQCDFGTCIAKSKRCDGRVDCPSDRSDERHCSDQRRCMWPTWNEHFCKVDKICIPLDLRCDGKYDCSDMTDEKNCPCKEKEFECSIGACISIKYKCDGIFHCQNGADEIGCTAKRRCGLQEFRCSSGECVSSRLRCDRFRDCFDGSDERECSCTREQYSCRNSKKCIEMIQRCDTKIDCPEKDDEFYCDCGPNSFTCQSTGHCISTSEVCDGVVQCPNGEDENTCEGPSKERCDVQCGDGTCFDKSKRCDGRVDCSDGADERDCNCASGDFRCEDGSCIPIDLICNNVADCPDNSDEFDCPSATTPPPQKCASNEFQCGSGECIREDFRCDQTPDCDDYSDEFHCTEQCEGEGVWCDGRCVGESFVCDRVNDCTDGRDEDPSICDRKHPQCASFEYECNDHSCVHYNLVCNGVPDCRDGSDEKDCDRGCGSDEWQCTSGECVKRYSLCDGRADCQDASDERDPTCRQTTIAPTTRPPYTPPPPVTFRPTWEPPEEGGCRRNEWRCENGPCILSSLRCNGKKDCPYDNSDELDCFMSGGLNLKTYPNDQIIKQSGEVVFQCRDEGPLRAPVKWVREGERPLPVGSTDRNGRLEMPNIQVADSGIYICQAVGYPRYTQGSELSVRLTVEPYTKIDYRPAESCKINEATCSNGDCIPKNQVCNGHYDCTDGSDELGCNIHGVCEPNEFKCANKRCILKTWVCDSEDDCKDGSDETNCGLASPGDACLPYEFQCKSRRQCVSRSFHCDGQNDCLDGSDEIGCSPVFISRPPPPMMILEEHSTMVITCIAHGVPSPEVVWRLNWGHIPEKCTYTSVQGVGMLTCPDIRVEDQGAYSCEALNNRGSVFAVPDTILVINTTKSDVCPVGYFNSEARVAQDCISCFCFGATTECRSAELFTYQLPPPLSRSGIRLMGVTQPAGQPLQITDEPISDIFDLSASDDRGITINRIGQWSPRNIYPYLALSENHLGTQLKSYGGYIKYTVRRNSNYPAPQGYVRLPDIIIKGGNILLTHTSSGRPSEEISVRLFQGQWQKVTPYGPQTASREDIMMVLANIDALLLRAEEYGSGIEINNFQMDTSGIENSGQGIAAFVEECKCPQGYSGLSCQKCSPGFTRIESGRWLGRCSREEEPCQPGYYGNPSAGVPCKLCPCPLTNPGNQFSRTCSLASDGQVTCNCPIGYRGRRCEVCAPGYVGNPTIPGDSCRPAPPPQSSCDPRGTSSQEGDVCRCKPNVVGSRCSECAAESFHLSEDNIFGCSQCFCMGVTRSCSSSTMRRRTIASKFASQSAIQTIKLIQWDEQPENVKAVSPNMIRSNPSRSEISFSDFPSDISTPYYWQLPDRFAGEKLTAYGGYLNYTVRVDGSENNEYEENPSPDIQLISNNDIVLAHYNGAKPRRDGIISQSVQILEQYWQRQDGMTADREHILMALADLQSILVKATYSSDTRSASLILASIQIADDRGFGERASHVEECQCPLGYLGTSCQDCAPGYKRVLEGLYLGFCSLCSCNEHSDECHPETGDCLNCQHNTFGPACEYCLPGYEGNATSGSPGACRPKAEGQLECRCDERGTIEPFCIGESSCRCKQNVEGERCDRCRSGTFKLSRSNPQGCTPCYCSGVTESCSEAQHLYKQQIPIGIIDDSHGFVLTSLDQETVIDANFQLDVPLNQISYDFGHDRSPSDRLFWSLPNAFTGNKLTSYAGNITITQKFDSYNGYEPASNDIDLVLVGRSESVYWKNPRRLMSGRPWTYSVPLNESFWYTLSSGDAPRPVSHHDFMDILSDIRLILVRATLSPSVTSSYIADVAMDTAVAAETGEPLAENIELCRCPPGYSGTSCEACTSGYYKTSSGSCMKCPCSGREEACRFDPRQNNVVCNCRPGYTGRDCSSIDYGNSTEEPTEVPSPTQPSSPSIQVVISAPTIENKPEGGNVQFICTARSIYSSAPIRVQWSKEGGSLPLGRTIEDSSRGLLAIRDLKVSDSGTYICQASDGISTGFDMASLTVPSNQMMSPQITLSPPILEVYEDEPIEIRCQVTGSPTPTLTWSKVNRRTMNIQHTFLDGVFRISSARPSDQGEYRCFATNSVGQDSKVAVVYVNPRPEFPTRLPVLSVNPSQPVIREGDSLTIVCSADHSVPPNFIKWTREDGFLPPNFRSQNGQLWMDSVRNEDAGVYLCSADQFPSRVVPASVIITVQRIPQQPPASSGSVSLESNRITIPEGQSYTVKCDPRGNPLPIIKWTKDGSEFGSGVTQRGNALVINQARMSDRGVYVCIGTSVDGIPLSQETVFIDIERREVPDVLIWPEGIQTVRPGGSARLQCRVMKGAPDPIISWSRPSGRPLTGNTHLLPDGVLSFTAITVNEEGIYTCTGSNEAGSRSANATIKLQSPPVLSISPDTYINAQPGTDVVLECRANGYPEPIVHWVQITPEEKILTTDHTGTVSYTLRSVVEDDEGMYACVARNEAGIQEERVSVVIADNEIESFPERGDIPGPISAKVTISSAKNLTKRMGDSLRIDCKGAGRINEISWTKLDSREYLKTEAYPGGSVLLLDQIGPGDSGTYRCEGYNRDGTRTFDEIVLYVVSGSSNARPSGSTSVSNGKNQDWQSQEPDVVSARLGSNVLLPCSTNLPTPVTFQWIRPHAQLPRNVRDRTPTLRLISINESDAGPYICRVSHGDMQMESRKILRVTHVVPKFAGDGFLELKTLKDAFLYFDIEVSIKPQDYNGIILYNSVQPGSTGDMVSLALVEGVPEFRYALSQGSTVIIRGDRPLSLEEWHTIKITRSRKDGYMYVDGKGPFSGSATSVTVGLDLTGPLYIGGVPDVNQLPEDFKPRTGFVGCIGRLLLDTIDVPLMKEAVDRENADACDTCSQNPCQNNGVCQESLTHRGYTCLCAEGYSGLDCAGTGESCMPGICGPGRCTDTNEGFLCTCPIGYAGQRCESRIDIEYPAFGGRAYLAFPPPQATRHLKVSMRVKPTYPMKDGLILYCAESRHGGHGDFTSLALKNGYLEYRYALGDGMAVLRSREPLSPNKWVNVTITRVNNDGRLSVEGQETVTGRAQSRKGVVQLKTPLYIGGYDSEWMTVNKRAEVEEGFVGCISDVKLSEVQLDIKDSNVKSANVQNCGENDNEYRPYRGDIPESSTPSYSAESEGVCAYCRNGGYCERPGDMECVCPSGYEGTYCETAISTESQFSPCDRQPCENGGTCRPTRQGSLYRCDCPKGTGGFQCRQRVELGEDVSLAGEGYVELPSYLLLHNDPRQTEVIAVAFTTSASDGLLVFQGDNNTNPRDGDFVMLNINGGYVELQWDLGGGVGTIQNTRVLVSDNQRHQVVVKRTGLDATLEVDRIEDHGRAPGMTTMLNADSNIYVGGVPSHLTQTGIIGFSGCIHQIEFQDSRAINFGSMAVASRNANPCSNSEENNVNEEEYVN